MDERTKHTLEEITYDALWQSSPEAGEKPWSSPCGQDGHFFSDLYTLPGAAGRIVCGKCEPASFPAPAAPVCPRCHQVEPFALCDHVFHKASAPAGTARKSKAEKFWMDDYAHRNLKLIPSCEQAYWYAFAETFAAQQVREQCIADQKLIVQEAKRANHLEAEVAQLRQELKDIAVERNGLWHEERLEREARERAESALRECLIPLAALIVSGACVDTPTELSEELKVSIIKAHDAVLTSLKSREEERS